MKSFFYFPLLKISHLFNYLIFLDIDGTLVSDDLMEINDKTKQQIKNLLDQKNTIYLCSNSKNHKRNKVISESLSLPIVKTKYKKPNPKILKNIPKSILLKKRLVIGDKVLTDFIFSKMINGEIILVKRVSNQKESLYIKIINKIDDFFKFIFFKCLNLQTHEK